MFIVSIVTGPWQTNCYVVASGASDSSNVQSAVIIDPGAHAGPSVHQVLDEQRLRPEGIICTHGHFDHVADAAKLANEFAIPVWLHPGDRPMLTEPVLGFGPGSEPLIEQVAGTTVLPAPDDLRPMADGDQLTVAGIDLEVIHAPGHTPGCVVLRSYVGGEPLLFSGDVLFAGSIGRVDLPGGSMTQMKQSLRRLCGLIDAETGILPGHGQTTTMARELATNPYLSKEALA